MDEQTIKAYFEILAAIHKLEEKTSHLRVEEIKVEQGIYSIPPEKDFDATWEDWTCYVEQSMRARNHLDRLKFKLQQRAIESLL
jgi:hypothetical protein